MAAWTAQNHSFYKENGHVFLPNISGLATAAQYEIVIKDSAGINTKNIVTVDQTSNPNSFITIATVHLQRGSNCAVILRDVVDSTSTGSYVSFDAVRFVNNQQLEIGGENSSLLMPNNVIVYPSYPNPFNSSATIRYEVLWDGMGINNQTVPSGLYYCVVESSGFRNTQKIVLLK